MQIMTKALTTPNSARSAPAMAGVESPINSEDFQALLRVSDSEWQGMMMLGRYCGLRLVDCARLRVQNVSKDRKCLRFPVLEETREADIPVGNKLAEYLRMHEPVDKAGSPLFPRCASLSVPQLLAEFRHLALKAWGPKSNIPMRFSSVRFDLSYRR
jgi:integrase